MTNGGSRMRWSGAITGAIAFVLAALPPAFPAPAPRQATERGRPPSSAATSTASAEQELHTGTSLTSQGRFREAIPHLLAARGHITEEYAAGFNLALCYIGTRQFRSALDALSALRSAGFDTVEMDDLFAQAYAGDSRPDAALSAIKKVALRAPHNEKLYLYVTDACMDAQNYSLGLTVAEFGLQHLPDSALLHFERGMFLTGLDRLDEAKADFDLAARLAPNSAAGYMALAEKALQEGDNAAAIRAGRQAVSAQKANEIVLQILGEALLRAGAAPGEPEFAEARNALEKSVALRPDSFDAQLDLGGLYLTAGRSAEAIAHLETARQLRPSDPAVYARLAEAYRRAGDRSRSQVMLAALARLNQRQVEKIRSAPGDTKGGYVASGRAESPAPHR